MSENGIVNVFEIGKKDGEEVIEASTNVKDSNGKVVALLKGSLGYRYPSTPEEYIAKYGASQVVKMLKRAETVNIQGTMRQVAERVYSGDMTKEAAIDFFKDVRAFMNLETREVSPEEMVNTLLSKSPEEQKAYYKQLGLTDAEINAVFKRQAAAARG